MAVFAIDVILLLSSSNRLRVVQMLLYFYNVHFRVEYVIYVDEWIYHRVITGLTYLMI